MRCVLFETFGDPATVLRLGDVPPPQPGPGQVRVSLVQSPIHNHDVAIIRGVYGYRPALPAIPGTEAVGRVDALGPDVSQVSVGQRVAVAGIHGAWAESFVARAAAVVPVPAAIPDEVACQLLAMPLSAFMLLDDLNLQAGDWFIQNAAGGAVGRVLDTLAAERGINVVNLVRSAASAARLEAAGARNVLSSDAAGWPKEVERLTGGAPIRRAVDSVGGKGASDLMGVLGAEGQLISFGALSNEPLVIDPRHILFKETVVKGFWATRRTERTSPAENLRMVSELLRLGAGGGLPLRVEATFPLAQAAEAVAASIKPGRTGKITLVP